MFSKIISGVAVYALTSWLVSGNSVTDLCGDFDAQAFVDELIESNNFITVSNYLYTGACGASGLVTFDDEENYVAYTLGIGETALVLTSGSLETAMLSVNTQGDISTNNNVTGDSDLESLVRELNEYNYTYTTYDASIIEFDIVSAIDAEVTFEYIFASDEYNEFANSQYNDVFGFWINGRNVALINNSVVVAINNVNAVDLSEYFISNDESTSYSVNTSNGTEYHYYYGPYATEYDGLTILLSTAIETITAGETIHVKLAISDTGDAIYDSAVFLKPKSFQVIGDETLPTFSIDNNNTNFVIPDLDGNNTYFDDSGSDFPGASSSGNINSINNVIIMFGMVFALASLIVTH